MELLSGPSLREEIQLEAPMTPARVASILATVAAALQLAHDRGITHRDLKPANIVAHRYESGDRVYKVIDFGLAAMKAHHRRDPVDRSRDVPRHPGLCRAGTDARRPDHAGHRHLCAGDDRLRNADRRAAVRREQSRDAHQPDADDGADEAGGASQRVVRGDRRRGDACAGERTRPSVGPRCRSSSAALEDARFDQVDRRDSDQRKRGCCRATSWAGCSAAGGWAA